MSSLRNNHKFCPVPSTKTKNAYNKSNRLVPMGSAEGRWFFNERHNRRIVVCANG